MLWDSCIAKIQDNVLCWLWQDNNAVLGFTTAHSLHKPSNTIIVDRKRPGKNSTSATVIRPVFNNHWHLKLAISQVIDDYNHNMNSVNVANYLRQEISSHLPRNIKW